MNLGHKLRNLRENLNKTQTEVAKDLKITPQAYSQYERNVRIPDIEMLKKISDYYSVSVDYLLDRTDSSEAFYSKKEEKINNNALYDLSGLPEEAICQIKDYIDFIKERYDTSAKSQNSNNKKGRHK